MRARGSTETTSAPGGSPSTYPWAVIDWTPFAAGVAAGLGIALPLGAIGVLIVREGVERGIRAASVAALAVATVDFGYALVAVGWASASRRRCPVWSASCSWSEPWP